MHGDSELVESLQLQLALSQQTTERLQEKVAELQQHNEELLQDNSKKADFMQSLLDAAAPHAKRPRMSAATNFNV